MHLSTLPYEVGAATNKLCADEINSVIIIQQFLDLMSFKKGVENIYFIILLLYHILVQYVVKNVAITIQCWNKNITLFEFYKTYFCISPCFGE